MDQLIGREAEIKILSRFIDIQEPALLAMYGRRRVGKTFLVRSFYKDLMAFEFTGIHEASLTEQLQNFSLSLQKRTGNVVPIAIPKNWLEAFHFLQQYLNKEKTKTKQVIFFDEFPWIHTPKSGFLQAFEHFWNTWASLQPNIIVVICGSAASWMIENIVNNKGGLHNRISQSIRLLPFTLAETEKYLTSRRIHLDRYQVLQLYMAMGGIPQYLKAIEAGQSAAQNIDRLCFAKDGILTTEFKNLYQSLFHNAQNHITVIKALAKKTKGLTRNEVISECDLSSGGTTTRLLDELQESGFITQYLPPAKNTKDGIYKLSDEYSLFYLKFMEGSKARGEGTWLRLSTGTSYISWGGFAFESVCQKHVIQVKRSLGIESVYTETAAWRSVSKDKNTGAQIDMLIDRQDLCINICEIKFSKFEFAIDKKYAAELENKINTFRENTGSKKTLFLTMITTHGIKRNIYYTGLVQNEVNMNALFSE